MRHLCVLSVVMCAVVLTAGTVSGQEYERVLLPVVTNSAPGAFGSLWSTFLAVYNGSDSTGVIEYPFGCVIGTCPRGLPIGAHETSVLTTIGPPPAAIPGLLVYVLQPQNARFAFETRVQDLSRQALTWGTELPAIHESAARTDTLQLLDIPLDVRFRRLLRVYDLDARLASVVRVRILPMTSDVSLAELDLVMTPYLMEPFTDRPFYPGYASLADFTQLPGVAGMDRVRIEIRPVTSGLRFWAFVSVTNNETQHVTTITPQ
jgi:hypothetical protein